MKMSSGFETVASGEAGKPYGHVPGHQYHDVEVGIGRRGIQYRCVILETWGSAQGYDEEHGRIKVVARAYDWRKALAGASRRAKDAGINAAYMAQAMSECEDAAADAINEQV